MDFVQSLQKAIDYIEENILEPITYEDVAEHVYMSICLTIIFIGHLA